MTTRRASHKIRTFSRWLIFSLLLALVLLSKGCMDNQFYYPIREVFSTPDQHGLAYQEVWFASGDQTRLQGWYMPAKGPVRGTVIQFHGNAQNMTSHYEYLIWMVPAGYNLFTFDYRGYGQSGGKLSRAGTILDGRAALDYIRSRPDVDRGQLYIVGQSLGGSVALAALAADGGAGVKALAIDSTFYSYRAIAAEKIGAIPLLGLLKKPLANWLISDGFNACDSLPQIKIPLVFIHGEADYVVPSHHSRQLYELASEPKELWLLKDGGHTELLTLPAYQDKLLAFFATCSRPPQTAALSNPITNGNTSHEKK